MSKPQPFSSTGKPARRSHFFLLGYCLLILGLSSIPSPSPPVELPIFPLDKLIHFLEYAGFAYFILQSLRLLLPESGGVLQYFVSLGFAAIIAFLDETYQLLIPGRSSDLIDVVADILGSMSMLLFIWIRKQGMKSGEM